MEYFTDALKKYADFKGRATVKQFWMYVLFYFIIAIVAGVIDAVLGLGIVGLIVSLGLLVPSIAITARRLHDTGRSGWWQLIAIIPLIGTIVLIVFCVQGSKEDNAWGPTPQVS